MKKKKVFDQLIKLKEIGVLDYRSQFEQAMFEYNKESDKLNFLQDLVHQSFNFNSDPAWSDYSDFFRFFQDFRIKNQKELSNSLQDKVEKFRSALIDQVKEQKILTKVVQIWNSDWQKERERKAMIERDEIFMQTLLKKNRK
ncbi:MAG: hypothetical protein NZ480_04205 [Bdellovibrionaceae bacterium]|nr:hypothetical protein [Pseudobdellovibrionaceae bacterium]MDW8189962.1 hypothetical protein [Pseudobdellovibrionaceae bacterium]